MIKAVSYTHLDVYKRQAGNIVGKAVGVFGTPGGLLIDGVIFRHNSSSQKAVSYTHLGPYFPARPSRRAADQCSL